MKTFIGCICGVADIFLAMGICGGIDKGSTIKELTIPIIIFAILILTSIVLVKADEK